MVGKEWWTRVLGNTIELKSPTGKDELGKNCQQFFLKKFCSYYDFSLVDMFILYWSKKRFFWLQAPLKCVLHLQCHVMKKY